MDDDLVAYYALRQEPSRLDRGVGLLELERTKEIVLRSLAPDAVVADVGGADGRYAEWLARRGHRVELVEPLPVHVELARERAGEPPLFGVHAGDARELPFADAEVDAVLLLGPLYHLGERSDRILALSEAARVCRAGGVVFAAAISRFAPLLDAIRRGGLADERLFANVVDETLSGRRVPRERRTSPFPDAYFHLPEELESELVAGGLDVDGVLGLEGPGCLLRDDDPLWQQDGVLERLLEAARLVESDPHVLAASAHLLAVGRVPG